MKMQHFGEVLHAGEGPGDTIVFTKGENADKSLLRGIVKIHPSGWGFFF